LLIANYTITALLVETVDVERGERIVGPVGLGGDTAVAARVVRGQRGDTSAATPLAEDG